MTATATHEYDDTLPINTTPTYDIGIRYRWLNALIIGSAILVWISILSLVVLALLALLAGGVALS